MLLGTLQRHRLGAHADGIAVMFLASACVSVIVSPLVGRWSDGRGRLVPIRIGLVLGGALLVVLALIESLWVAIVAVVVALVALRAYWGPALAMLSEARGDADIGQVWGPGARSRHRDDTVHRPIERERP